LQIQPGLRREENIPACVQFSVDGSQLLLSNSDGVISAWDTKSGKFLQSAVVLPGNIRSLAVSADGSLVACSGNDGNGQTLLTGTSDSYLNLYDAADGKFNSKTKIVVNRNSTVV